MKMMFAAILMASLVPLPSNAQAADGFAFKKKAVDPFCVEKLLGMSDDSPKTVDLKKCGPDGRTLEKGDRFKADKDGWIGFENADVEGMTKPFFQYRIAGTLPDGDFLLETQESGGGTGVFSGVAAVSLKDNKIAFVKSYGGGDRCNGGIGSASVEDGKPVYTYNVTPADIVNAFLGAEKYKPYDDLESSAASCFGEIEEEDGAIKALILDKEALASAESGDEDWVKQYPYQACFNEYMAAYVSVAEHPARLNPDEAKKLVEGFDETCGKNKDADQRKSGRLND